MVRAFSKHGWQTARQRGSHIILTRPGHVATLSVEIDGRTLREWLRIDGYFAAGRIDEAAERRR